MSQVKMRRTRIEHMSADLPPIADIARRGWHGSFVPIGDIQQTKCDGVKELDKRNRGKRVWTQIGWGRSHLIGQPHSLQSACPLGGILLSAKR
jgi:hypothetical protein